MANTWDPAQYLSFADHRLRPAAELLARVRADTVASMVDLGCGAGTVAPLLRSRWPEATYLGVDSSPEMLDRATADQPEAAWLEADVATWRPDRPVDLLYSNAALHWLPDHQTLLPELMAALNPGGVLAVQMPANFDEPTHTTIAEVAQERDWSVDLEPLLLGAPVDTPGAYHRLLSPVSQQLDIWTTTYLQELSGPDAVTAWVSGSALRPVLTALTEAEAREFTAEYTGRVNGHYPRGDSGTTLLPFTRLFLVATAPDAT
ncbi:MAG: methyltransferase domain-containing protein [Acidimicrobiales bacterium]